MLPLKNFIILLLKIGIFISNSNILDMHPTKQHWTSVRTNLSEIVPYSYRTTKKLLIKDNLYKRYIGKAKNRTFIKEAPKLYKSVMSYTEVLKEVFKKQKTYKTSYNLSHRIRFIVELDSDIKKLRCECGKTYNWTRYCRYCPEPKKVNLGKKHSDESKKRMRLATLKYLSTLKGQLAPRYNRDSIQIIEQYGIENGYKFMHAENGGEYFVRELGYFLDAYDPIANVALEVDEEHHFDRNGNLLERDITRQKEIEKILGCEFIRIQYDRA